MSGIMDWVYKQILEKWAGRVIVLALAAVSGWLAKLNIDTSIIVNWVDATKALLEIVLPLLFAWLLGKVRLNKALNTEPPVK